MAFWDRWKLPRKTEETTKLRRTVTSAPVTGDDSTMMVTGSYVSDTFGIRGNLKNFDYDKILADKEGHIKDIYALADYYVDKDPLIRGIIKEVYTPFSCADKWRMLDCDKKSKQEYGRYYQRIELPRFMRSVFLQYYKYGNVFIYLMPDGRLITLPVNKMRIGNIVVNGEPTMEMDTTTLQSDYKTPGAERGKVIKDDKESIRKLGLPPEVVNGINAGKQWVQLDPRNSFVLQDAKEDWSRYAYPLIVACLPSLAKKELISAYEDSVLNLGMRGFIHAQYGDPNDKMLPNKGQLTALDRLVKSAMTKTSLATTNCWAKISFVQPDVRYLYEYDKYKGVNNDILSAGGVSGIIVSGVAQDGSTFASAQVSMQTAEMRILQARNKFEEMMDKVNRRVQGMHLVKTCNVPRFRFEPVDLKGSGKWQETCYKLWKDHALSTETMLQAHGFDMADEINRLSQEAQNGVENLSRQESNSKETEGTGKVGRPEMDDSETDKSKSETGRMPKPSNPEGSMPEK